MHDVFISYSHIDTKITEQLCKFLEDRGVGCWYAKRNIQSGEVWADAIVRAIRQAKIFIVVFSDNSNKSNHVLSEISVAMDSRCTIIPFRVDETNMNAQMSYYLMPLHWLDAASQPMDAAINQLGDIVFDLLNKTPATPQEPPKKKKRNRSAIIITVIVAVCLVACAVTALSILLLTQADDTEPFDFYRHKSDYPFVSTNGMSSDGQTVLLKKEDGTFILYDNSNRVTIANNIEYQCDDPTDVIIAGNTPSDYLFFINRSTNNINVYDKKNGDFLCGKDGITLSLYENEAIDWYITYPPNILMGTDKGNELALITSDTDNKERNLFRSVSISCNYRTADDTDEVVISYSSLDGHGLTTPIAYFHKENVDPEHDRVTLTFVLDTNKNIKVLDTKTGEVLDISRESLLSDYLPYAKPIYNNTMLGPSGTYLMISEVGDGDNQPGTCRIWDVKESGLPAFEKKFFGNYTVVFVSETEIACLDAYNSSFYLYDLASGKEKAMLLEQKDVEDSGDIYLDYPFAFDYNEHLNAFILHTSSYNEEEESFRHRVIVMDMNGDIIAYSKKLIPFENECNLYTVQVLVSDDAMSFAFVNYETLETELYTRPYSIDENGKPVFGSLD